MASVDTQRRALSRAPFNERELSFGPCAHFVRAPDELTVCVLDAKGDSTTMDNHLMLAVLGLLLSIIALVLLEGLFQYVTMRAGLVFLACASFNLLRHEPMNEESTEARST